MAAKFCSLVGRQQAPLEILDVVTDPQYSGLVDTPVISYCGVLIRDAQGQPYGTLCHYDMQRCQERTTDQPLLEAAAAILYQQLHSNYTLQVSAAQLISLAGGGLLPPATSTGVTPL